MAAESVSVDISPEGPKTRSRLKRAKGSDSPSRDSSSCPSIKTKKKKFKKPKKATGDGSSIDGSDSSEDDYQYVIDGPNLDKRIKVKYVEEIGVEDEIRDLKDAALKKEIPNTIRPNQVKGKGHRSRNMNSCATCDEPGEDLIICARCPNSFHPSCMTVPTTSKKSSTEPWICLRCSYETNDLNLPRRLPKVLPFSEESRFGSIVDETLKKEAAEGNVSFERALEVYGNLSNPRTFSLPRELLDELVDMPYMEHIPRKILCQSDAVCFVCKENHTEKNPCIQCDYCPAAFHLHCQNIPMTAILNEFWMCPLHAEIAIDRFALSSVSISSRMFLWNRSRTAIKGKKTFKSFVHKTKRLQKTQTKIYSFEDVPTYVDSSMLKQDFGIDEFLEKNDRFRTSRSLSLPQVSSRTLTRSSSRFSKASSVNSEDGNILNTLFDESPEEREECSEFQNHVIPHRPYPESFFPVNPEDKRETLLRAAEYLNQYKTEISNFKNYHETKKYDMSKFFERKSELPESTEPRHFPLHSAPFEHYGPEEVFEERGHYSIQDLRPRSTYVSSSGGEKSTTGMAYASVADLYYDDSYEDYRERAICRLKTYHKSLLKEEGNSAETNVTISESMKKESDDLNPVQQQQSTDKVNLPKDGSPMEVDGKSKKICSKNNPQKLSSSTTSKEPLDIYNNPGAPSSIQSQKEDSEKVWKLSVQKFGDLFDGQLGFPIKTYYFVRYYAIFHTDGEKIYIRYSKVDPENQMSLPKNIPEKILDFAPEVFTECYEIEELEEKSNIFGDEKKEESKLKIFSTSKDARIWFQCFDQLRNSEKIKNKKETTFDILKAAGFRFKKNKRNKISIVPPIEDKEIVQKKVLDFVTKVCQGKKVKDDPETLALISKVKKENIDVSNEGIPKKPTEKNESQSPTLSSNPGKRDQEDPLIMGGLEKEFEESDESVPASVKQESTKKTESESPEDDEGETISPGSRELRRWSSVASNDDVDIDSINLEDLDLDTLIPEKPSDPDVIDRDKKEYRVETPDFRRYLRKANAEISTIRKLITQLKRIVGQDVDEVAVTRKTTKKKKIALSNFKKQLQKRLEPNLEEFSPKQLFSQILEGRKRFNELVDEHRAEGTKNVQPKGSEETASGNFSEILEGRRVCKTRMTSLNENAIVKAAFNAPSSSSGSHQNALKSGLSGSTQSTTIPGKRRAEDSESTGSASEALKSAKRQMKSVEISGSDQSSEFVTAETNSERDSSKMEVKKEQKRTDDDVFAKPELPKKPRSSPSLTGKIDLFKVALPDEDLENPLKFAVKAVAEGGQEKWYNVTLPEDFYESKSKKIQKEKLKKSLKEKIVKEKKLKGKKVEIKKPKKVQKEEEAEETKNPENLEVVVELKEEKIPEKKKIKKKKTKEKRNPPPDPRKSTFFAKKLMEKMLPSKTLVEEKFDFSKLISLESRKVGDFFYLMYCKNGIWKIVSRIPFFSEVLASEVPSEIRELISLQQFDGKLPEETEKVDYCKVFNDVVEYERANSVLEKKWKMNSGVLNLKKVEVNENAEYSLDKRFLKPDLPIMGTLIQISPVHSFSVIPIHFPSTSFGFLPNSTVDISLLFPPSSGCRSLGPNHACISYDKLTSTVYLQANSETIVDGEIYGDNGYPSRSLKCRCNRRFESSKAPIDRLSRAPLKDNSVIEMGCLKFTLILMNLEQIWSEIPGTCPSLSMSDGGIGVEDNINDLPEISDSDLTDCSNS